MRSQKYLDFYRKRVEAGDFVILDNGAAEDVIYGAKHLHTLADDFGPTEIVVPDTIGDPNETLAKAMGFTRFAMPSKYQYMFVLQGRNMDEVLQCLRTVHKSVWASYITTLGIPRHFATTINKHFRVNFFEFLLAEAFDEVFEIHFLGANNWIREAVLLAELADGRPNVRGLDTSLPIYMGLEGSYIGKEEYVKRPNAYFDIARDDPMIQKNVDTYLEWAMYDNTQT